MESSNITPDFNSQNISPQEWVNLLQTVCSSHQTTDHQDLVVSKEGRNFQVMTATEIIDASDKIHRLSLEEIINISKDVFDEALTAYRSHSPQMDARTFLNITKQISSHLEQLITAREAKRNQISKKALRGLGWTLSAAAASISKIGESFYQNMQQDYQDFQKENMKFRKIAHSFKNSPFIKEMNDRLERVPKLVAQSKNSIQEKDIIGFITQHMQNALKEKQENPSAFCLDIFASDIKRGIIFHRTDAQKQIEDKTPVPPKELLPDQKVEAGVHAILELIEGNPKDVYWEVPLEIAATQTSLNALFDFIKGPFVVQITSRTWKEEGKQMALLFAFTDELPPVHLEIMRNSEGEIFAVLVEVEGAADIVKGEPYQPTNQGVEVIAPRAILGKLAYTITLAENHAPEISNVIVQLKSNL
jgi:hypothetical protein